MDGAIKSTKSNFYDNLTFDSYGYADEAMKEHSLFKNTLRLS